MYRGFGFIFSEPGCDRFPRTPNGEGRTDLPSSSRRNVEVPPASTTTTPRLENSLTDQATMTILQWQEMPCSDANLPFERWHACWEAAQHWSELACGQATAVASLHEMPQYEHFVEERILITDYSTTQA
jgi:hypothetical protein